jgi:hypothetical protein
VSQDWWPLSDADPVPGDPETLAALGKHMTDAAAEIERMATMLPRICTSETWDSSAGAQFRVKAASTAASVGRTHHRFFTVARALGNSTYGGNGYAARLQEHQDKAAAALTAVNGSTVTPGSETERLRAWAGLLTATRGADPAYPLPKPATTATATGTATGTGPTATGRAAPPMPQASPGYIPPPLPVFPDDPADVTGLKRSYNGAIDQLSAAARSVASAVSGQAADAHTAAQMILTAIDNDGLNNPSGFLHWLAHTADDVRGFVAGHWIQFVADLANVAGAIATVCGIIALVLAFIPGLQEFAALFETVALLAQFVAFACHTLLLATGHGSLLDVIVDGVGLITFGVGKGLIGGAEATADTAKEVSSAYQATVKAGGGSVGSLIESGDTAAKTLSEASGVRLTAKAMEQMKKVVSVRPVFRAATKAWEDGKFGKSLGDSARGTLSKGFKDMLGMSSPEIGESMSKAVEAEHEMPNAQGVAWVMTSRIQGYHELFRITQSAGLLDDGLSKADAMLNYSGHHFVGFDNLKSALPHGEDG